MATHISFSLFLLYPKLIKVHFCFGLFESFFLPNLFVEILTPLP